MKRLLVEIGTEEIPAGYIAPALDAFQVTTGQKLTEARIAYGSMRTFGTPMRLALDIADVEERQAALAAEIIGPPEAVGFDADGKPTVAAHKFADKAGVDLDSVFITDTAKGRYLCARKTEAALETKALLAQMLPDIILGLPFPKTMRWAELPISFARPIRWLVALFGEDVVSFRIGNLISGRTSRGHRVMAPGSIEIPSPDAYEELMAGAKIAVDAGKRRQMVETDVRQAALTIGGTVKDDPELVDIVTHLVEFPVVVAGRFEDRFLELPDEVLITSMREHQKYFAVADAEGSLMPHFIVVNNTRARDMDVVVTGHERVLRARLEDALFFYKNDLGSSLDSWVEKLSGVLFQAKLGSMAQKTERVRALAGHLADLTGGGDRLKNQAERAARLCKADLLSQVVVEFPKLQGVMGRIYAKAAGESDDVAAAIEEHYRPVYSGGPLPQSMLGSLLAIADKLDTLCGCFSAGLIPTGGSDPYALRRQSIGIILMLRNLGLSFSLSDIVGAGLKPFAAVAAEPMEDISSRLLSFLRDRISHLLVEEGKAKDTVLAVVSVSSDQVPQVWEKVTALEALRGDEGFDPLAVAFKRVANIIRKARQDFPDLDLPDIDTALFEDASETALWRAFQRVESSVDRLLSENKFDEALSTMATLREPVDAFFEGVMVMADNQGLRRNRLAILARIAALFETIADFSKLSV